MSEYSPDADLILDAQPNHEPAGDISEFDDSLDIAIVGMAGRFPGARTVEEYWSNLKAGVCSVTRFDDEELAARGVDATTLADPNFVGAGYVLADSEKFDAAFFGYSPREAELMDPQHRVLLECAWAALESSGHDAERHDGLVGVYAGAGNNTYLLFNIASQPGAAQILGDKQTVIGNRPDFLASRVSYKLGLEGPALNIQSACSTSLVAVVEACQALLAYQCDTALAGGVAVDGTRSKGYVYRPDGIFSPDGYCRTFDARAQGTVGGDGVGMVVLKRLKDAITDNDHIHAVIKGTALNNDGSRRAGFSAPSAATQASAISTALSNADVPAESIGYIELHGTATILGDPIEFSALASAYSGVSERSCALGSAKTNIGHLDSAAGVAGLIKAVLAVEHGQLPPTLHFERPNPRIDLAGTPFYINTELLPWPEDEGPRRAGVSSFGLGGTNAHVILEQAPALPPRAKPADGTEQLLVLSAKSPEALEAATDQLHDHLRAHPELPLADVAFTLQQGRRAFPYRRMLVCGSTEEALEALDAREDGRLLTATAPETAHRPVAFMFTGFGTQFPGMARELYAEEAVFRAALDECAGLLEPLLGTDIRELILTADESAAATPGQPFDFRRLLLQPERSEHPLDQPRLGYPAVFALEYALVELWAAWGVQPEVMIGHSLGEYVAACVAGVFSLPDALRLVAERARLIEEQGEGAMLAVPLAEEAVARYTDADVCLAAINGPQTCVLSGTVAGIDRVAGDLLAAGIATRRLTSRFAFHSPMMDPVVDRYAELVRSVRLNAPAIPFVSNLTGTWITDHEATSPEYWARHVRESVRFADGLGTLWSVPDITIVEIGPAPTLTPGALQHPAAAGTDRVVVPSLPGAFLGQSDRAALLRAAGRLWLAGRAHPFPVSADGRRVPLPTYPFERRTYWLEPGTAQSGGGSAQQRRGTLPQWFYAPSWQRLAAAPQPAAADLTAQRWLVFADETGVGRSLADRLEGLGATVRTVVQGAEWHRKSEREYVLNPAQPDHFHRLAEALRAEGTLPGRVVHCWSVGDDADRATAPEDVRALLHRSFDSLVHWAQATEAELMTQQQRWDVLSTEVYAVLGDEPLCPPKATVQGLCKVLPQEYPSLSCVQFDLRVDTPHAVPGLVDQLLTDLAAPPGERTIALRGRHRWTPTYVTSAPPTRGDSPVRPDGVYLITGGLGKIGLLMARALADRAKVRLVLLGRKGLPPRESWTDPQHPQDVRSTIRAVQEIEALGSEVLVTATDVSDLAAMLALKERILREFGPIAGVLHCAGTTGKAAHREVAVLGQEEASWHFAPKLYGTQVLHEVLADQQLDFALICSSIASLLGGLGFGAYAAANAVLDAFAQRHHSAALPWTSVNWEAWYFSTEDRADSELGAAVRELALTPAEGRLVVDSLLDAAPQAQIVISTGDLMLRQELWSDPVADAPAPAQRHERPNLRNPFVAPNGETERQVAEIWQELLGVDSVGVQDNFFELGGSSLLGLQVVHRLRQDLAVAVPLTIVYEGPTVRTLGALIDNLRAAQ
ncbi:type I polyketide synthase [Catellatospora tritici]|uniref:type I polyketide synthase n=1 Tax=Catellatospora tritici TaxID=2851566 RepID=UPI001C2DB57F|nr:type I polyketide synthase [Catellatospora tritici]MBV1855878.1 acyltransferase domain-containing protein [Catellatospora tritici]